MSADSTAAFLAAVLESLPYPFYVLDASSYTILQANSAAQRGRVKSLGATCYAAIMKLRRPCEGPSRPCPLEEMRRTGNPCTTEHVKRDRHGGTRHFEVQAYPVLDDAGRLTHSVERVIDITEKRQIEQLLRSSEARYRSLFDSLPLGVSLISMSGRLIQANQAMFHLTGFPQAELKGKHARKLFRNPEEYDALWSEVENDGFMHRAQGELTCKDGTVVFARLSAFQFSADEEGQNFVLLCAEDVSRPTYLMAALRRTTQTLQAQQAAVQQKSMALSALIDQIEVEKRRLRDEIGMNIRELILPLLEKLRVSGATSEYIDMLEHRLQGIAGSFGITLARVGSTLSLREIEISGMIEHGLTTKEIAGLLGLSYQTVERHRRNIRKKIGISGQKINLASFLRTEQ